MPNSNNNSEKKEGEKEKKGKEEEDQLIEPLLWVRSDAKYFPYQFLKYLLTQ